MLLLLKLALIMLSIPIIFLLVSRAIRNARKLNEGIEEYRKEQEIQPQPNPHIALSELFTKTPHDDRTKGN